MFRASLCPSSGESDCILPHMVFCTDCDGRCCEKLGREPCTLREGCCSNIWFAKGRKKRCPLLRSKGQLRRFSHSLLFHMPLSMYELGVWWTNYVNKNKWVHASSGGQRHSMSPEMTDPPVFWKPIYIYIYIYIFVRLQPPTPQTKHAKYELNSDHIANNSDKGKVTPLQARCGPEGGWRYSSSLPRPWH
jgi:hypothetical protein